MYIGLMRYLLKTANRLGGRLQVACGSEACQTYARYNPLGEISRSKLLLTKI